MLLHNLIYKDVFACFLKLIGISVGAGLIFYKFLMPLCSPVVLQIVTIAAFVIALICIILGFTKHKYLIASLHIYAGLLGVFGAFHLYNIYNEIGFWYICGLIFSLITLVLSFAIFRLFIIKLSDLAKKLIFFAIGVSFVYYLISMVKATFFNDTLGIAQLVIDIILLIIAISSLFLDYDVIDGIVDDGKLIEKSQLQFFKYMCSGMLLLSIIWVYTESVKIIIYCVNS